MGCPWLPGSTGAAQTSVDVILDLGSCIVSRTTGKNEEGTCAESAWRYQTPWLAHCIFPWKMANGQLFEGPLEAKQAIGLKNTSARSK